MAVDGQASFFPADVVHAAKDVLSSIVGSAMCVYTGQPFDTGNACVEDTKGRKTNTWRYKLEFVF